MRGGLELVEHHSFLRVAEGDEERADEAVAAADVDDEAAAREELLRLLEEGEALLHLLVVGLGPARLAQCPVQLRLQ